MIQTPSSKLEIPNLVPIRERIPTAIIDLPYATSNNITGKQLYPTGYEPKLRESTLKKLAVAEAIFRSKGYSIVIFDALRTPEAHAALMEACPDPKYVNPNSGHLLGVSIDLTLADKHTGKYLDFGTEFDEMSPKSGHAYSDLPSSVIGRRILLSGIMEFDGDFVRNKEEWWHYDDLATRRIIETQQM